MPEVHDNQPAVAVATAEYLRLLGYPRNHEPTARAAELMAWARDWYAQHGRPWIYYRQVALALTADGLLLDGQPFASRRLHAHMRQHGVVSAVLFAASAGEACEAHARQLWGEGKPDEYFFLETYGSAVVEDLVARAAGRLCAAAEPQGLQAVPHYSPGYAGWDVAEQNKLLELITRGKDQPFSGPLEVLSSGMLRPKKSLLAVFGLALVGERPVAATPCANCSFAPCQFRRAPYRPVGAGWSDMEARPAATPQAAALTRDVRYATSTRALRKWAEERVRLESQPDGTITADFRFDGTTCSNQGRPLAFGYRVTLAPPEDNYRILAMACAPVAGDDGYQSSCAYLSDPTGLMQALATEKPLLGEPLEAVFAWSSQAAPSGCHCTPENRVHKWRLALEAVHYALVRHAALQPVS